MGIERSAATRPPKGTDQYRFWWCTLTNEIIEYAPRPTNTCCPTETTPANPASRFHITANDTSVSNSTILRCVELAPHVGRKASRTITITAITAKILLVTVPRTTRMVIATAP